LDSPTQEQDPHRGRIINIDIEDEMRTAYIDYSMSVIVSRALPDVRDGLKPVHRRVLFGMLDLGLLSNKPHKKSARIVGEVLGKYHPHGDLSVYDAMVRMAQPWTLRYKLIDGQGNFGSVDGDTPAAMRYTEARFHAMAEDMLDDIHKNTVDWASNFDDSLQEPTVLPSKIPNLLLNGSSGIAVGMATNIPPHNLKEIIDGIVAFIDKPEITIPELMKYITAPDFPTGGVINGIDGIRSAYETGRGRILLRAKTEIISGEGKEKIVITEIPYQVNRAKMLEQIGELINNKKIEGISDIKDLSDRNGTNIIFELKRDAISNVVLNNLFSLSQLEISWNVNTIALVGGRPKTLSLKELIEHFVNHRHEVVVRRTQFDLSEAEKREHILKGLLIALDNLDAIITLIRSSQTPDIAKDGLMNNFNLSEIQAKAILEMRLQRLTGLEREKIQNEYEEVLKMIEHYKTVLAQRDLRMNIIKDELLELKNKYGDERRTLVIHSADDRTLIDMIAPEEMVITISHAGYIKRTPLTEYRRQNRGGKGSIGAITKDEDFTEYLFVANTHNYILFFTETGTVFWLRAFEIPEGAKASKGRAIQNLINISPSDKVRAFINVETLEDSNYINNHFVVICTEKGMIKKSSLEAYSRPRQNGIAAISINEGDRLLEARMTDGHNEIVIALRSGRAIRFNGKTVRPMGRTATGVKAVTLANANDKVMGMVCLPVDKLKEIDLLVVSDHGYGKRSSIEDYRVTNRGGKGVKTINITEKTGQLVAIKAVNDSDDLIIITKNGILIRMSVNDLRVMGRATQGVRLINLDDTDEISSVASVSSEKFAEEPENGNGIPDLETK